MVILQRILKLIFKSDQDVNKLDRGLCLPFRLHIDMGELLTNRQ